MREVKLPSGATLKVAPAPFADAKALYQAVLEEAKVVSFSRQQDVLELMKNIICFGFSSRQLEAALTVCMSRCQYDAGNGALKIDKDTFEPVEAREDYPVVCLEVIEENVRPFSKSLSAVFARLSKMLPEDLA